MIKFETNVSEDEIFSTLKRYFVEGKYWAYVNYISDKFELCSQPTKSQLLTMLGQIYYDNQSYDKSILACQFALKFDEKNADALLILAKNYRDIQFDFAFKETFMNLSISNDEKIFENPDLIDHFNNLNKEFEDDGLALIDDQYRFDYMCECARELVEDGDFDGAVECYEHILQKFPDKLFVYDALGFVYKSTLDEEKYIDLCEKRYKIFPNDPETIALYLFTRKDFDDKELYCKLLNMKIDSINLLKTICSVAEYYEDFENCLKLVEDYAENNDCKLNHDLMVMKFNTLIKIGKTKEAKYVLTNLNIAYGVFGLGLVCKHYLQLDFDDISISNINYVPDSLCNVANNLQKKLQLKLKKGIEPSQEEFWTVFELLAICLDEDDIKDFLMTYKEQFTLKNPQKIAALINMRAITDISKTGILVGLLSCGVEEFYFFHYSKIDKEIFCKIDRLAEFPHCYYEAYLYAFAYCGLKLSDFSASLKTSTIELLDAMEDTKRKFRDQFALAGAIIVNAYLVFGDNVAEEVARLIECNPKRLARYLAIIKKEGEFFSKNEDDMFEMLLKRVSMAIIDNSTLDD